MKKFILAIAFASTVTASATAQTSGLAPRDPPFGKANLDNDTMHEPSSAGSAHGASTSDQSLPPRDPPFGKATTGNDSMHLPSSALTRGASGDSTKPRNATTRSAVKKDAGKKDGTPKDIAPTDMD